MPNDGSCSFVLRCDPSHLQIAHASLTLVPRFYLFGRKGFVIQRFAVVSGLFIASLVFFLQATQGMGMEAGLTEDAFLTLVPWAGFLILTGYVVGGLAEKRAARLAYLKNAYMATLEVLTFHIESAESNQEGHSTRVAELAAAMGAELKLSE